MDSNESITDEPSAIWPEMSSDITAARTVARSITLDTQRASTDGRVLELSSRLQSLNARMLELETRIATGQGPTIVESDGRSEALEREVAELRTLLSQTNDRLESQVIEAAVAPNADAPGSEALLSLDSRMAAVESARVKDGEEVNQLMSYLEQAFRRLDELTAQLSSNEEALRQQVGDAENHLAAQVGEVRTLLESQVADVETNLAADVSSARSELQTQVEEAEARLRSTVDDLPEAGASTDVTDALGERLDELSARVDNSHARMDEIHDSANEANGSLADRVDAAEERLGSMQDLRERLDAAEGQFAEIQDLRERLDGADGQLTGIHELRERLDNADGRLGSIDELRERLDNADGQLTGIHELRERLDNADDRLGTVDELRERLDNADGQLTGIHERLDTIGSDNESIDARIDERVVASEDRLAERIKEARELLAAQQQESSDDLTARLEETQTSLASQVTAVEEDLAAQVAEARGLLAAQADDTSANEALEQVDLRVTELDEQVSNATSLAIESQHFTENLRVLQTDLVKAIQAELEGQAERLGEVEADLTAGGEERDVARAALEERLAAAEANVGNADARLEHLETTIVSLTSKPDELGLAPANPLDGQRLSTLETRLDDVTSSIENLAELQHRATGLDTSLTESMSSMTAALEQNTAELHSLRNQLDEAHARIAQLEGEQVVTAEPFSFADPVQPSHDEPDAEPAPEPEDRPSDGLRVADVIGETRKEERLTPKDGSDWFVASYARKDKGRGRFRRS